MKLYSSNNRNLLVDLEQAVLQSLAPDQGLYLPAVIPAFSIFDIAKMENLSLPDISLQVAKKLIGTALPPDVLKEIVAQSINFPAPLVKLEPNIFSLELFHGPTLAFKDFGARFMANLLKYYANKSQKRSVILVATSGDTGGAVASSFLGSTSIDVVILYPSGKISDLQEKQLTTLGQNIHALEIAGNFDDCQKLVKLAFSDNELRDKLNLSSANSINIARLIPQSFYYFHAYAELPDKSKELVVSVPSGNFGNLTAGVLAKRMGLPIKKFVAATNINAVIPEFLSTGVYNPAPSKATLSNAMDVGNPSNFARLQELMLYDHKRFQQELSGYAFDDQQTLTTMKTIYQNFNYICDPHGAVGYLGLKTFLDAHKEQEWNGIFLETAHPGKFKQTVDQACSIDLPLPDSLKELQSKTKQSTKLDNNYIELKQLLSKNFNL